MATERDRWIADAKKVGAPHIVVVCDTFSHENYPVMVKPDKNVEAVVNEYNSKNMQRVVEVIDVPLPKKKEEHMRIFLFSTGWVPDTHIIAAGVTKEQALSGVISWAKQQNVRMARQMADRKTMLKTAIELKTPTSKKPRVLALIEVDMGGPRAVEDNTGPENPNPAGMRR